MEFLILRVLQHSELGMFHSYRRRGLEGSRQRAVNFDSEVVDRVFPAATDLDRILLQLRYDTDDGFKVREHSLKRQAKNWRFEGNCPTDKLYYFVEPGCLFALQVDAGTDPATGAWVVFPKDDPTSLAILADGATASLVRAGMIALEFDEAPRIMRLLAKARPDTFVTSDSERTPMTNSTTDGFSETTKTSSRQRRLPPGPERLAAILADAGHSFVSAVADIIDNSISAGANRINITFNPPNSGNGRWLAISDNGKGMSVEELEEAMRIGGDVEYEIRSLGKYGYGLKGASWSQARVFTVVTRQRGGPLAHLSWDQDNMADWRVDDSPLESWESTIADPHEHGTTVLWKKMKAPTTAPLAKGVAPHVAEIQGLNRHLGLVFHRFLDGDAKGRPPITIEINGVSVESCGPVSHPLSEAHDAKTLRMPYEGGMADVKVQPYVLPSEDELKAFHASEGADGIQKALDRIGYWGKRNETQGLFIYRNDRLIRWGGWHEMWATNDEKMKLARVVVDFPPTLDEAFQINISKQTVRLPSYLQEEIKKLADPVRKASRAKYLKPRPTSQPTPPPQAKPAMPGMPLPNTGGGIVRPAPPSPPNHAPQSPTDPPIAVRLVTTTKFAWKIVDGLTGGKVLQVNKAIPSLAELAQKASENPEVIIALTAFLEKLDETNILEALIRDVAEA